MSESHSRLATNRDVALVEILDRALGAGIVITGDITISLADVDLVYLSVQLLVGSVGTVFGQTEPEVLTLGPGQEGSPSLPRGKSYPVPNAPAPNRRP